MKCKYFTQFISGVFVLAPAAFGQTFGHCWTDTGKKIDGPEAKTLINVMMKNGVSSYQRPQGDEWNVSLICQNVWVMPRYSRMYYLCSLRDRNQMYSVGEADSAAIVKTLESHGFPSESSGEITRWQVKQLSCGTSRWTHSSLLAVNENFNTEKSPEWTSIPQQKARRGISYFLDFVEYISTENQHPIECTAPVLPSWLSLSGCEITGTPGQAGRYNFEVIARDSATGLQSKKTILIDVN